MKVVEVRRRIAATPSSIWTILTNARLLQDANLGITKLEGEIRPGSRLKLWSEVSPDRAFALKVVEFEPDRRMVWQGGMPLGLFTGRRQFNLTPAEGETELHMREEFTGLMSGLICKSMPDLQPSFDQFADGIKTIAEGNPT